MRSANGPTTVITCRDVYKTFARRTVLGGYTTFKTQLVQWLRPGKYREQLQKKTVEVLRGVSFEVAQGETLGIIGQNGAGKSTLLKLLTGIYQPTRGSVHIAGRISALLELGAGFHPEYSGRENIYMNGMILGLSRRELRRLEPEIVAFSELEEVIDAPVRTYSSGMYMRLAFAVAVNVNPDILIIDEILAVGDEHFQHKSKARLDEFKTKSKAIVLVTHSLGTVEEWCTRAIWLDQGKVRLEGDPRWVTAQYRAHVADQESALRLREHQERALHLAPQAPSFDEWPRAANADPQLEPRATDANVAVAKDPLSALTTTSAATPSRWGDGRAHIEAVTVQDEGGQERYGFKSGEGFFGSDSFQC